MMEYLRLAWLTAAHHHTPSNSALLNITTNIWWSTWGWHSWLQLTTTPPQTQHYLISQQTYDGVPEAGIPGYSSPWYTLKLSITLYHNKHMMENLRLAYLATAHHDTPSNSALLNITTNIWWRTWGWHGWLQLTTTHPQTQYYLISQQTYDGVPEAGMAGCSLPRHTLKFSITWYHNKHMMEYLRLAGLAAAHHDTTTVKVNSHMATIFHEILSAILSDLVWPAKLYLNHKWKFKTLVIIIVVINALSDILAPSACTMKIKFGLI